MTLLKIFANITADNKILYVPLGWEGWLFIAAYSNLALKLLHQLFLSFLGGFEGVSYNKNKRSTVTRTNP